MRNTFKKERARESRDRVIYSHNAWNKKLPFELAQQQRLA